MKKLRFLLDATTADTRVWAGLAKTHQIELDCALFLESFSERVTLPSGMLREITRRRWTLEITAYSAEVDEILDAFFRQPRRKKPVSP
jgi:hypothetical protein